MMLEEHLIDRLFFKFAPSGDEESNYHGGNTLAIVARNQYIMGVEIL